jgi:hypothetical protein
MIKREMRHCKRQSAKTGLESGEGIEMTLKILKEQKRRASPFSAFPESEHTYAYLKNRNQAISPCFVSDRRSWLLKTS